MGIRQIRPIDTMPSETTLDDLFECVANHRRRTVLTAIDASQTPISVCELARLVASSVTDASEDGLPTERIQRIYLSLYHAHLPKLAAAQILDYGPDSLEVAEGPRFGSAIEVLESVG